MNKRMNEQMAQLPLEGTTSPSFLLGLSCFSFTQGSRKKPCPDGAPDQVTLAGDAPPSEEQQEPHYASFSFHGMKEREPQDQEATSTSEYSEIKISK